MKKFIFILSAMVISLFAINTASANDLNTSSPINPEIVNFENEISAFDYLEHNYSDDAVASVVAEEDAQVSEDVIVIIIDDGETIIIIIIYE